VSEEKALNANTQRKQQKHEMVAEQCSNTFKTLACEGTSTIPSTDSISKPLPQ